MDCTRCCALAKRTLVSTVWESRDWNTEVPHCPSSRFQASTTSYNYLLYLEDLMGLLSLLPSTYYRCLLFFSQHICPICPARPVWLHFLADFSWFDSCIFPTPWYQHVPTLLIEAGSVHPSLSPVTSLEQDFGLIFFGILAKNGIRSWNVLQYVGVAWMASQNLVASSAMLSAFQALNHAPRDKVSRWICFLKKNTGI